MRQHAVALDTALAETITALNMRTRDLGQHKPVWQPSGQLMEKLRRVQLGTVM